MWVQKKDKVVKICNIWDLSPKCLSESHPFESLVFFFFFLLQYYKKLEVTLQVYFLEILNLMPVGILFCNPPSPSIVNSIF